MAEGGVKIPGYRPAETPHNTTETGVGYKGISAI